MPYYAKDVVCYFCEKFEETYKDQYLPNFKRDTAIIKNTLLKKFSQQEIEATIDYIFKNYSLKWATKGYPRPTIGALTSWLFNSAYQFKSAEEGKIAGRAVDKETIKKQRDIDF